MLHEANKRLSSLKAAASKAAKKQKAASKATAAEDTGAAPSKRKGGKKESNADNCTTMQADRNDDDEDKLLATQTSLARIISLVAQAVHYFRHVEGPGAWGIDRDSMKNYPESCGTPLPFVTRRGSRVESYTPLQDLMARLVQQHGTLEQNRPGPTASTLRDSATEPFLEIWAPEQVLRLALGMVYGHARAVGASEGPAVLSRWAQAWSPLFSRPSER